VLAGLGEGTEGEGGLKTVAILSCPLLTQMATAAGQGGPDAPASEAALLDCLQEHPLPEGKRIIADRSGKGLTPRWVYKELGTASRMGGDGWWQFQHLFGTPMLNRFRYSLCRGTLGGLLLWYCSRSDPYVEQWRDMALIAHTLHLGLFLAHDPSRRRFPWLMGLVDRPTIGLQVFTWR
jgi:hypothetical protein